MHAEERWGRYRRAEEQAVAEEDVGGGGAVASAGIVNGDSSAPAFAEVRRVDVSANRVDEFSKTDSLGSLVERETG